MQRTQPDERRAEPLKVAVLYGGDSPEREISLESGRCVAAALAQAGHRVHLFDPARQPIEQIPWQHFDGCFLALHGGAGEDGRVQSQLEQLGIPYTGPGPAACRVAMSKSASKERFYLHGVPTLPYVLLAVGEPLEECQARVASLGYPLVVKPDGQGSSLGVLRVERPEQLAGAVRHAGEYDAFCLVEPFKAAREFTVAVWDDRPLPTIEIVTPRRWFDYDAKYAAPTTQYLLDPPLPADAARRITDVALAAAAALGTTGMVRVDLLMAEDGRPVVLEVNTTPGMTSHSLVPMAARHAGLDMPELCDQLFRQALAAAGTRKRRDENATSRVNSAQALNLSRMYEPSTSGSVRPLSF